MSAQYVCDTPEFMGIIPNTQSVDREAHAESKWLYVFDLALLCIGVKRIEL